MKITVSSPDGLGDFILRLPMLTALRDAGHILQLLMRRPAADLAAFVFPDAEIHLIGPDPYHPATRKKTNPFKAEHRAIHCFGPDVYVAALFHLNFFDQIWIERGNRGGRLAGFTCNEDGWSSNTTCHPLELSRQFSIAVPVTRDLPEVEKNHLLTNAMLERIVDPVAPHLEPSPAAFGDARALLHRHGLREGGYWIACVGTRKGIDAKDWGEKNWMKFFDEALSGRALLFLGNPKESPSVDRIRNGMSSGSQTVSLAADPPAIPLSLALIALSAGYVGRDSGVMHMAAAMGRPLLAIFAGGHWGRFLPVTKSGVVVTQDWPCRGCEFCCAHDDAQCIRSVPMSTMIAGWHILQNQSSDGLRVLEIPLPAEQYEKIARVASRKYAKVFQEFERWKSDQQRPINGLDALGIRLRLWARKKSL